MPAGEGRDGTARAVSVDMLGPLRVHLDGRPVAVTAPRLRTLLCVLALSAGRPVPTERLASAVWGERQPVNSRRGLATYVTRLRGQLGTDSITTRPGAYLLPTAADLIDVVRFERLLAAAAATADPAAQRSRLVEALALWRGEPFEDVRSAWLNQAEAPWLVERYLGAVERCIDLDLAGGDPDKVVAPLRQLTTRHPLRESLWVRLLVALEQCGRTAEALVLYDAARRRIAEELGVDPSAQLQRVYADLQARTSQSWPRPSPDPNGVGREPAGSNARNIWLGVRRRTFPTSPVQGIE